MAGLQKALAECEQRGKMMQSRMGYLELHHDQMAQSGQAQSHLTASRDEYAAAEQAVRVCGETISSLRLEVKQLREASEGVVVLFGINRAAQVVASTRQEVEQLRVQQAQEVREKGEASHLPLLAGSLVLVGAGGGQEPNGIGMAVVEWVKRQLRRRTRLRLVRERGGGPAGQGGQAG
ncbi:hypothetical protein ABPG75_008531 [Micractinium tetrahymenae]